MGKKDITRMKEYGFSADVANQVILGLRMSVMLKHVGQKVTEQQLDEELTGYCLSTFIATARTLHQLTHPTSDGEKAAVEKAWACLKEITDGIEAVQN